MTTSHIVQHTHWDREWYFTTEDALVLSDQLFTEAMHELLRNPKASFCLDGQSSIIDEYIEINPDELENVCKLVAEGRLFLGPWFTQTDALLVDAESILRNLMIGIHDIRRKYGEPMMIGYLPDTFGFNAQMPTILQHAGIDSYIGWRGINFETQVKAPYFQWKGLGDKVVFAANMPHGYSAGVMPVEVLDRLSDFVRLKLDPETRFAHEVAGNEHVLMPAGVDQKSMLLDFDKIVDGYNETSEFDNVVSDYPSFIKVAREAEDIPGYRGELREPVYARVHRSIGSVRTQMKQADFELEQQILRRVEPLMVIAQKAGVRISTGLLTHLWKKLLENQAHDSMGGCVSDNVAEDIFHRIKEAREVADGIENLVEKRIADNLGLGQYDVLVFNTDPVPFHGEKTVHVVTRTKNITFPGSPVAVIEHERYYPAREHVNRVTATGTEEITEPAYYELDVRVSVDVPALGYTVLTFADADSALEEPVEVSGAEVSNEFYTLSFAAGALEVKTVDGEIFEDFVTLTDIGNDGDTYDFSPLKGTSEDELRFSAASVRTESSRSTLVLECAAELPFDREDRLGDGRRESVAYRLELTLAKGSDVIEAKAVIDNQVLSHRMRLKVHTGRVFTESIGQIQNGFVRRTRQQVPEDWESRYVEMPAPIEIFDKSVTAQLDTAAMTVFADGLKEYEQEDDALLVTLFATTGELGKRDLAWRPGRASGDTTNEGHIMMPTPLAQEVGVHEIGLAFRVVAGQLDEYATACIAAERLTPSVSYQKQVLNLFIHRLDNKIWPVQYPVEQSRELSVLELPEGLLVNALMPSLIDEGYAVVRLANPSANAVALPPEVLPDALAVNAIEEQADRPDAIAPYDYVTLKVKL